MKKMIAEAMLKSREEKLGGGSGAGKAARGRDNFGGDFGSGLGGDGLDGLGDGEY